MDPVVVLERPTGPEEAIWVESIVRRVLQELLQPKILIHVLPGGRMPERKTDGAIGFDAFARAVVSNREMDPARPFLRKTLLDFQRWPSDPEVKEHAVEHNGGLAYRLDPGQSILVGLGILTAMPFPMFYWVAPRSGLATKQGISVTNAPGTVDPDYRGEAGALLRNNNPEPFLVERDMRIVQQVFQWAAIPRIEAASSPDDLPPTLRGAGGFGSTGNY